MLITRDKCESELIQSLSRYIGYTTGAYDISRIADIVCYFKDKPSLLEIELSKIIQVEHKIKKDYAIGIINFCSSLGLVTRHSQGGRLAKISISPLGRSYNAAHNLNLIDFKNFLLAHSVIQNDTDIYCVLLGILNKDGSLHGEKLHKVFLSETLRLRQKRTEWLYRAFPNHVLRDRITKRVQWIQSTRTKDIKTKDPKIDFARHHSSPRKGWAKELGHLDVSGNVSESGKKIIEKFSDKDREYFWLGPPEECYKTMRIDSDLIVGPFSPAWNVLKPESDMVSGTCEFIDQVTEFMIDSYSYLRLVNYNQAPIESVMPYVYYLESRKKIRINEKELLTQIFSSNRNKFALMSKRNDIFGHFQLRKFS